MTARWLKSLFAASHRSPSSRRVSLSIETLDERITPSLTPTSGNVFSDVVRLRITWQDGTTGAGSGQMIGANTVLTAGHCLYSAQHGGWAQQVRVEAGYNNGDVVATATATSDCMTVMTSFYNKENQNNQDGSNYSEDGDLGLIMLDSTIGFQTGWVNVNDTTGRDLTSTALVSIGYPGGNADGLGYDTTLQYWTLGTVQGDETIGSSDVMYWVNAAANSYGLTDLAGQSGSGLWEYNPGTNSYSVDGIITSTAGPFDYYGRALRITTPEFNVIQSFLNANDAAYSGIDTSTYADRAVPGTASEPSVSQLTTVANDLTHSSEFYSNFVAAAYHRYLGRTPAASEDRGWVAAMHTGLSDERLEAGFIGSPEYIANHGGAGAGWVRGMYVDLLGRVPAQTEINGWVQTLNHGVSTYTVAYGFAASAEREGQRVAVDYSKYLGRTASQGEVNAWVKAFEEGTSNEDVIAGFVGSAEYFGKHQSDAIKWLDAAYLDILGRPADSSAEAVWLPLLS
jgi:V8-like Glu-specific endopeptidase